MKDLLKNVICLGAMITLCGLMLTGSVFQSARAQTSTASELKAEHLFSIGETADGKVGVSADDGRFSNPQDVAINSKGDIYVTDQSNHRVQKFDSKGKFLTKWGSAGENGGQFINPTGIFIDKSDHVFIVELGQNGYAFGQRIQEFDADGNFLMKWIGTEFTDNPQGRLAFPYDMIILNDGSAFVTNTSSNDVKKYQINGNTATFVKAFSEFSNGEKFGIPTGIASDASGKNIFVVDPRDSLGRSVSGNLILKFDSEMNLLKSWASDGSGDTQLHSPQGIAVDSSGRVFVADAGNNRISVFDSDGNFLYKWGNVGSEKGQFRGPTGVATDAAGKIYVADNANARVQVFTLTATAPESEWFTVQSTLDGNTYTITGNSLAKVKATSFTINPHQSVDIQTQGKGEVTMFLSKNMIDGVSTVTAGQEQIPYQITASNSTSTTIRFSVPENTQSVTIMAAFVVPEFGVIAALVMAVSIAAAIGYARFAKGNRIGFGGV